MGNQTDEARESHEEEPLTAVRVSQAMNIALYLQVVSILIGVVAVALPILITLVAFVYVKRLTERAHELSDEVDQLWRRVGRDAPGPG